MGPSPSGGPQTKTERVLVVGATGTLGRPTLAELKRHGYAVWALTRSERSGQMLRRADICTVTADLLDGVALFEALALVRPDAIVALLSARPPQGLTRVREFRPSIELWEGGASNLLDAAAAVGVRRLLAESVIFAYGYGDRGPRPLDEDAPASGGAVLRGHRRSLGALRAMERSVLGAAETHGIEGLVVRSGIIYGARVPSTDFMRRALERGRLHLPGGGKSLLSWVHSNDAAAARVAALVRGRSGEVYNVADERPATFHEFAAELAARLGAPSPRSVPMSLARLVRPHAAVFIGGTRLVVSPAKARSELGWRPNFRSFADGLAAYVGDEQALGVEPRSAANAEYEQ